MGQDVSARAQASDTRSGVKEMGDIADFAGYLDKLSNAFTDEEREWFVDSFARHMRHRADPNAFVVSIEDVVVWLGFRKKETAVRLLKEHFVDGVDFATASQGWEAVYKGGGHNKVDHMLNVKTFKKMCMIAKTAKADTVRDYYVKMEDILMDHMHDVIQESKRSKEVAVSETLIKQSRLRNVFYIAKIEELGEDDGIYKAGCTDSIEDRSKSLRRTFGADPVFWEVIITDRYKDLEAFVLQHKRFRERMYTEPVNGKHKSRECFRGSVADFEMIRDIARDKSRALGTIDKMSALEFANIKLKETELRIKEMDARLRQAKFDAEQAIIKARATLVETCGILATKTLSDPNDAQLRDQYDKAIQALSAAGSKIDKPDSANSKYEELDVSSEADVEEDVDVHAVYASAQPKVDIRHGRAVQRFRPNTLEFVDSFPAMALALQACGDETSGSPSGLKKAIENNRVYLGYRWAYAGEDCDDPVKISATVEANQTRPGLIAKLHPTIDKVVEVYATQKEAAEGEGLKTSQTISLAIHKPKKMARGHRWMYWKNVAPGAREEYLTTNELPDEFGRSGRSVRQMHAITHDEIHVHRSIGVVCKKFSVGTQTVKNACELGHQMKGFAWEWVEE